MPNNHCTPKMIMPFLLKVGLASSLLLFASAAYSQQSAARLDPNQYFYYPDAKEYSHPADYDIAYEEHFIRTPDSETLHLWVLEPNTAQINAIHDSSIVGTIVHFHGNAQNMSSHFRRLAWMLKENLPVRVVSFDYRGYGKSTGEPSQEGLVTDGLAVLRWASQRYATQNAKQKQATIVAADSLGGAVAMPSVALFNRNASPHSKILSFIIDSSFASYRAIAKEKLVAAGMPNFLASIAALGVSETYSPDKYFREIASLSALVFHAKGDNVVPYSMGRQIIEGISQVKSPHAWQFLSIEGGSHAASLSSASQRDRIRRFLFSRLGE